MGTSLLLLYTDALRASQQGLDILAEYPTGIEPAAPVAWHTYMRLVHAALAIKNKGERHAYPRQVFFVEGAE